MQRRALVHGITRRRGVRRLSNEALYLFERVMTAVDGAGVFRLARGVEAPLPGAADLALRSERAANPRGPPARFSETDSIGTTLGDGDALLIVGDQLGIGSADLDRASSIVYIGTALPASLEARAAVVLPITNVVEEEGTLTNLRGRVQRFLQAKAAPGVARPPGTCWPIC